MTPELGIYISAALPEIPGVKYGALLQRSTGGGQYVYVRLDEPHDYRWFLAELTTDVCLAAPAEQVLAVLQAARRNVRTD